MEIGNAYKTEGGQLKQKLIIHLAIPVWRGVEFAFIKGNDDEISLLMKAFSNGLKSADEAKAKNVIFTDIGSGIFGFPRKVFFSSVIKTIIDFSISHSESSIKEIRFVHSNEDAV